MTHIIDLAYCSIDTNDRFEFAVYDSPSHYSDEFEKSKLTRKNLDLLQKGVDFNSCYEDGRNYIFLKLIPEGLSYNDRIVFSKEELHFFNASIKNTNPEDVAVNSEQDIDKLQYTESKLHFLNVNIENTNPEDIFVNSEEDIDKLPCTESKKIRNYVIKGTTYYDESLTSFSTECFECHCNNCKHSEKWLTANKQYISLYAYINPEEIDKKWLEDEPSRDTIPVIKESIEFIEDNEIIHVGRLGAHIYIRVPNTENNSKLISEFIYPETINIWYV